PDLHSFPTRRSSDLNGMHGKARIEEIDGTAMLRDMEAGVVPIVAGFQGVGPNDRIATLGRGGSDTSAVALAAALKADRCDIYTEDRKSTRLNSSHVK